MNPNETLYAIYIIPAVTLVLTYLLIKALGKVPQVLVITIIIPVLGLLTNYLIGLAGSQTVDPQLAVLLSGVAVAIQKGVEHWRRLISAKREHTAIPYTYGRVEEVRIVMSKDQADAIKTKLDGLGITGYNADLFSKVVAQLAETQVAGLGDDKEVLSDD